MRTAVPSSILRHSVARQALHQQRAAASKRLMSSSAESSQKKAQDALSAAQKNAEKVWESTKKFLEPAGEKVGKLLGSYRQPLVYNFQVTKEIFKQIYHKENLQPPTLADVKYAYSYLWSQLTPALPGQLARSGEAGRVAIYGLQAYGIFKIGEIVGRRSVVGYSIE
ncbi:mitochondrial ATP synthase g subunit-domain-containing protein [Gymnopilus junonius]|uniref:Mitochondrial ATP synthase g subunit-domain-containing protein n=1 Tax=Gymnopilus junonius TaxID=109634 RepID=A0A9P5NDC1_GYMJU|nr:mitochondrial ATP synthase g subunit-domain-containing protein [Gymnopilus junonius]